MRLPWDVHDDMVDEAWRLQIFSHICNQKRLGWGTPPAINRACLSLMKLAQYVMFQCTPNASFALLPRRQTTNGSLSSALAWSIEPSCTMDNCCIIRGDSSV